MTKTTVSTPDGPIDVSSSEVAPEPQERRPLSPDEANFLAETVATTLEAAKESGIGRPEAPYLEPFELDALWETWYPEGNVPDEQSQAIVPMFGFLPGELLAHRLHMEWCVVCDSQGTDFALYHPLGEATCYPLSSVLKRLERFEVGFFARLVVGIEASITELRRLHGAA